MDINLPGMSGIDALRVLRASPDFRRRVRVRARTLVSGAIPALVASLSETIEVWVGRSAASRWGTVVAPAPRAMRMERRSKPWVIILAAGDGTRLRSLTRALHGTDLPKQFAQIQGERSLLQATVDRALDLVPAEHIVIVVAREREALARSQLAERGPLDIVAQPRNIGTGPGILLPLSRVLAHDPDAVVTVLPSDHYVRDERSFLAALRSAEKDQSLSDDIALLGAEATHADTEYGWIVPGGPASQSSFRISAFKEKPPAPIASELFESGAFWNTFVMVGRAARFWELARQNLPAQTALFEEYRRQIGTGAEGEAVEAIYGRLPAADFSRDVLQAATRLRVFPLPECGWNDWGTPARVFESLRGTGDLPSLLTRLRGKGAEPAMAAAHALAMLAMP